MGKNDTYFLNLAYIEALKALKKDEVPVGAIIVKDNKVISKAYNLKETKKDATSHAEILALKKAYKKLNDWYLKDCIMYVTLEPCTMCASAILQSRIKKVIYGSLNVKEGAIESILRLYDMNCFNHNIEYEYIKDDNCSKILVDYFANKRGNK